MQFTELKPGWYLSAASRQDPKAVIQVTAVHPTRVESVHWTTSTGRVTETSDKTWNMRRAPYTDAISPEEARAWFVREGKPLPRVLRTPGPDVSDLAVTPAATDVDDMSPEELKAKLLEMSALLARLARRMEE